MLTSLSDRFGQSQHQNLTKAYQKTRELIESLNQRQIPSETEAVIQTQIDEINATTGSDKALSKRINQGYNQIVKLLVKELGLVPQYHYRNYYMAIGMAVFGIPFGLIFSMSLNNYAFIGIGLPIGMAMGIAIGTAKDQQAAKEGKQL